MNQESIMDYDTDDNKDYDDHDNKEAPLGHDTI
jgi:hypothetical protein